jgi:hypothetical protein
VVSNHGASQASVVCNVPVQNVLTSLVGPPNRTKSVSDTCVMVWNS